MPGTRLLVLLSWVVAAAAPGLGLAQGARPPAQASPSNGQGARPAAPAKVRIAVMDIRPLGTDVHRAELLSEVALTEAGSLPGFDVIGRSEMAAVLGFEKQRQAMGCTEDAGCLAEIGGALGVDYLLIGSLGQIGVLTRLDLKLVETRKARVRNRVGISLEGQQEKLVATTQQAVRDLLAPIAPSAAPPRPAPVAARPDGKPATAAAPAKVEASADTSRRTWAYWTGGAGLVLLAGGAVAGLQARSALDDAKSATDVTRYDDASAKARSMARLADGLLVAGAIGVGVGTYLYFTGKPPAVAVGAAPVPGGMVATIAGGF